MYQPVSKPGTGTGHKEVISQVVYACTQKLTTYT